MKKSTPTFTLKSHFEGKELIVREIYDRLLKNLEKFGPLVAEPKKTSIHLINVTALAGVMTRKNAIVLTIKSDRPLASARIHKSEQVSANRFHHELKLTSPGQVDEQLLAWLERAYALSA